MGKKIPIRGSEAQTKPQRQETKSTEAIIQHKQPAVQQPAKAPQANMAKEVPNKPMPQQPAKVPSSAKIEPPVAARSIHQNPVLPKPTSQISGGQRVTLEDLKRVELPSSASRPQPPSTKPKAPAKQPSTQTKPLVPGGVQSSALGTGIKPAAKAGPKAGNPTAKPGAAKPAQDHGKAGSKPSKTIPKKK
eukprot:TRINITY_DN6591_c0_g1_i10.p1 TRINITY_DN6591_c0_g1~~TRINITY_DN6591_c0_g1_i10.p1  ORF type:complete len:190 (-),score=27.19 TRINITY_DN6591_c0_g1_i10:133-702(-)